MRSFLFRVLLVALVAATATAVAHALVEPEPTGVEAAVRPQAYILEVTEEPSAEDASAPARAIAAFRQRTGGSWRVPIDRRTGKALLLEGSGLPMVPGAGNGLNAAELPPGLVDEQGRTRMEGLDQRVRAFLGENRDLFLPERGELVLNGNRSAILKDGRLAYVDYDWVVDGVPVEGARIYARINNGNLIQAGTRLVGRIEGTAIPRIDAAEALTRARAHGGQAGKIDVVRQGKLMFLPVANDPVRYHGPVGAGVGYRLAWEVAYREPGRAATWTARVDARTGEVIEFYDGNYYAAQVVGGVFPRTVVDPEVVWPFPLTSVTGLGQTLPTDINGELPLSADGSEASILDGRFFDTFCNGCTNPSQPFAGRTFGSGFISFGTGGVDQNGNGRSTRADRNAFYHLNIVRLVAKKWLIHPWLETRSFRSNVNINQSCNAYYDGGSVNFYRSSATCNNTGEISDVMQHEWGHGLDLNTAPGDGATSEATADTTAVHVTHSPLIGPHFRVSGNPVRNLDSQTTAKGLLTTSNVASKCGPGSGPLGREVHCEGEIYGQTTWDLANALVAKYGTNTGWRESEHIFFTSLPQSTSYLGGVAGSIYDAYIAADDDDGNLANGTPNGGEIYAAFSTHGIAGTPRVSSPHCARPAQPVLTATPGCDQVALSWEAIPGVIGYRVQKHWQSSSAPFMDVASVGSGVTSYADTDVTPGITYRYVVQAVNGTGCESSINVETLAAPLPRPRLDVTSVVMDDTAVGNRSGTIDPGESVDILLTLDNVGVEDAGSILASLSSASPGVTVTAADVPYGFIAAGGSGAPTASFRIAVSGSVPCGSPIDLTLGTTSSGTSCPLETNAIRLETGTRTPVRVDHTFESTNNWVHDSASSTTSAGAWTRGDPFPTNYQAADDVTPNGTGAWYTATNSSGLDDNSDVDSGVVTLLSPVMDLTGLSTARLSYWRWFGQRDLGDDVVGDYFTVEVSNNGGSSWSTVETLGDSVNAATWTRREYAVESLTPLTSSMRFRVRVSDAIRAGDTGDIIEGAIDEFKITDLFCDLTPPCFTPPTFDGIDTAAAGEGCGEATLSWAPGTSHCTNATVTYNVYRSLTPGFTPSPATLVASNVAGLGYLDAGLAIGTTYYYIVRANDSRSGEDANMVAQTAIPIDGVPPTFAGIGFSSTGYSCGETVISWAAGSDCTSPLQYDVFRSTDPLFTPSPANKVAESTTTAYIDAGLPAGSSQTYVVRARDTSGNNDGNTVRVTVGAFGDPGLCSGCPAPTPVGTIQVSRLGPNLTINWAADPISAARYAIYRVSGSTFGQAVRIGTTPDKFWTHQNAVQIQGPIFYFVSAVDACGQESAIDTEP